MLHYTHQLVANCVCLPVGAEQVVYCGILELFHWKQLPAQPENNAMRAVRVTQNRKVVVQTAKQIAETSETADSGDNTLQVHHNEQHLSHCHTVFTLSFDMLYYKNTDYSHFNMKHHFNIWFKAYCSVESLVKK